MRGALYIIAGIAIAIIAMVALDSWRKNRAHLPNGGIVLIPASTVDAAPLAPTDDIVSLEGAVPMARRGEVQAAPLAPPPMVWAGF